MTNPKWFASLVLSATVVSTVSAETRCPGNVASITPRIVQGALIVIPVKVNEAGPFDFMVDTGSQTVVIDPSLASELHSQATRHGRTCFRCQLYANLRCRSRHA